MSSKGKSGKICLAMLAVAAFVAWSFHGLFSRPAEAASPRTIAVTTDALRMTGTGGGNAVEIRIRTPELRMTGVGL